MFKVNKKVLLGISLGSVLMFTTSCSTLDFVDVLKPSQGIETSVAVGKDVQTEKNNIKLASGNTSQEAKEGGTIENGKQEADTIKNITQNVPLEYLLLFGLVAGWAVPSPSECYKGIKSLTTDLFSAIVVTPLKGIANFVLSLFGREKL